MVEGLRGDKNVKSTIKILSNAFFSPDFIHFSIKVAGAPD